MRQIILKHVLAVFLRTRLAAAVAVGLLTLTASVFATNTGTAGGSGGTSYSLSCGSDKALVGIKGKAGSLVDSVEGFCAQINDDGSWQGTVQAGFAGGSGGTNFSLYCAPGQAVTGIRGRAGSYVDQLQIRCGPLGQNGRVLSLGYFLSDEAGGTGGSAFGPFDCPDSMPARLIRGRAAKWVDAIGLGCDYVDTLRLSSLGISSQSRVGKLTPATVMMSTVPLAPATVTVTSNNTDTATAVVSQSNLGTTNITPLAPRCTKITASYKGSSVSADLLVHSAESSRLSLITPPAMTLGQTSPINVRIPSPAPAGGTTIKLTSIDPTVLTVPASVTIPQGAVLSGFQVTAGGNPLLSCARIKATGNGGEVTNAIRVSGSLKK